MRVALSLTILVVATAAAGTAVAARGPSGDGVAPFAATDAAASGREVPAQLDKDYVNVHGARVVGADSHGQQYALSRGTGGHCLIAVRGEQRPGFEACGPSLNQDVTAMVYLGAHRIRTVVLQANASSAPITGAEQVALGLWVAESDGELPGG
jgi:hypothetical protein